MNIETKQFENWTVETKTKICEITNKSQKFLTYRLDSQLVLEFVFIDSQLELINALPPSIDLKSIPTNLPNANLIKYFLKNSQSDPGIFKNLAQNYFQGPLCDYLDYRLKQGLIISKFEASDLGEAPIAELMNELISILDKEQINHTFLKNITTWIRDYGVSMGSGKQWIPEENLLEPSRETEELLFRLFSYDSNNYSSKEWPQGFNDAVGGDSTIYGRNANYRKAIIDYCQKKEIDYEIMKVLIEGGNVVTFKLNGKIYAIVGKNLRIPTALYRRLNQFSDEEKVKNLQKQNELKFGNNKSHNPAFYSALDDDDNNSPIHTGDIKEARLAIEECLNLPKDQIIWTPNDAFHMDMSISIGPKCLFINNYLLTANLAYEEYKKTGDKNALAIYETALIYYKNTGEILEQTKKKLDKYHIPYVDVPGVVHAPNPAAQQSTETNNNSEAPSEQIKSPDILVTNFMNGYSGFGKQGNFYITLACNQPYIQKTFVDTLKANGVDNVYFVGTPEVAERILSCNGSIRCLSKGGSVIGNIASPENFIPIWELEVETPNSDNDEEFSSSAEETENINSNVTDNPTPPTSPHTPVYSQSSNSPTQFRKRTATADNEEFKEGDLKKPKFHH